MIFNASNPHPFTTSSFFLGSDEYAQQISNERFPSTDLTQSDMDKLSSEAQEYAANDPETFLKLKGENALDDLSKLSTEAQKYVIQYYPENFLKLKGENALDDLSKLSPEAQKYVIQYYPENFLKLKGENAVDDLAKISPELQRSVILSYPENFLKLKGENALDDLCKLSPEAQKHVIIHYPKNFLKLKEGNALNDLAKLPPELQRSVIIHYPKEFLKLKEGNALDDLSKLPPELQRSVIIYYPENFLKLKEGNALDDLAKLPPELQRSVIIYYPEKLLKLKEGNAVDDLSKLSPEAQHTCLMHPIIFLKLREENATDLISENLEHFNSVLWTYPQEIEASGSPLAPKLMNAPDSRSITQFHRDARNGNLQRIDRFIHKIPEDQVVLNTQVYFSSKTLEDCRAPSQFSQLDQVPLDQFAFPFIVAQNYCNALIKMKDGSILTLQHTDAKKVYDSLTLRSKTEGTFHVFVTGLQKMTGTYTPPPIESNRLYIYLNPAHGLSALNCSSCAHGNGSSFEDTYGFHNGFGADPSGLSYSRLNQLLKLTFYINNEQAKAVWEKQDFLQKHTSITDYNLFKNNCIDFTVKVFGEIGEPHPYQFFTEEQLSGFSRDNVAIQYARFKYKHNMPTDFLLSAAHLASLIVICKTSTFFYKTAKTGISSALRFVTRSPASSKPNTANEVALQSNEMPTYIKNGLLNMAGHGVRYAVQIITGTDSPVLAAVTNSCVFANIFLLYKVFSADPLNKNKAPSLWNRNISLYVASGLASTAAWESLRITNSFLKLTPGNELRNIALIAYGLFFSLVAFNEIQKLYHSITEAPNIDGLSLE